MINAIVERRYPSGSKPISRAMFRAGLEEQNSDYIELAYKSLSSPKLDQQSAGEDTVRPLKASCPRCGYTCQLSTTQIGKFYCGFCTEANGDKFFFTSEAPF